MNTLITTSTSTAIDLSTKSIGECIKSTTNILNTTYTNICNGSISVVQNGSADIIMTTLLGIFLLGIGLTFIAMVYKIIFD